MRSSAASALGKLGNVSEIVITALLNRLQDENSRVHFWAAFALDELVKKSSDVLPALTQWISQHQDSDYVGNGIDALWDMVVSEQS